MIMLFMQRRREFKKVGGTGSCNFPTDSCKFSREEIVGAQNLTFALKLAPNFAFWTNIF